MAKRITIDIADDGATSVSVESDGSNPEQMNFASPGEALDAITDMVGEQESPEAMWDQEAASRPAEPTPMM